MNGVQLLWKILGLLAGLISLSFTLVSPARGEMWDGAKSPVYIEKNKLSLHVSLVHPYPPARRRDARVCVYTRGGVKGETWDRYFPAQDPPDGRGNSSEHRQSLFSVSACFAQPTTHEEMRP